MTIAETRYASAPWSDEGAGLPSAYFAALMAGDVPDPDLGDLLRRPGWMRFGSCRGMPVDVFVPPLGGNGEAAQVVCGRCPVIEDCLSYALADESLVGVWGGMSEKGRKRLRGMRRDRGVPEPTPCVNCGAPVLGTERCELCRRHLGVYGFERGARRKALGLKPARSEGGAAVGRVAGGVSGRAGREI